MIDFRKNGYRNVVYRCREDATTPWEGEVILYTWDNDGNRVEEIIPHASHCYIERKDNLESEYTTLLDKPLERLDFPNVFNRKKWINENPKVKIYDSQNPVAEFLSEYFWQHNENPDFSRFSLLKYSTME